MKIDIRLPQTRTTAIVFADNDQYITMGVDGTIECIECACNHLCDDPDNKEAAEVNHKDIPNLIKALELAYKLGEAVLESKP